MITIFDAIFTRMNGDADLKTKVGIDANGDIVVYDDWPDIETDWEATPVRLTITIPSGAEVGAVKEGLLQVDLFVHRRIGTNLLGEIDERLVALFDEAWWTDATSGRRISTVLGNNASRSAGANDPRHWMREIAVTATV